jgi:hypothetical protein
MVFEPFVSMFLKLADFEELIPRPTLIPYNPLSVSNPNEGLNPLSSLPLSFLSM